MSLGSWHPDEAKQAVLLNDSVSFETNCLLA